MFQDDYAPGSTETLLAKSDTEKMHDFKTSEGRYGSDKASTSFWPYVNYAKVM